MSEKSLHLTDDLHAYLLAHSTPLDPVAADLVAETHQALAPRATMQIAPEQAHLLTIITQLLGARQAVEIGTFTGLSALSIARGLPPGGRLICFDASADYTAVAQRYWQRAGVADRIELRIGDAHQLLPALPAQPHLDLAFIDADKTGYARYWDELVPRMRSGGVLLVDNVLQGGRVVDSAAQDENVTAIRAFNQQVRDDDRVEAVVLPVADGLTLARCR